MRVISRHGYIGSIIVFARVDAIFKIRIIPYPKIIIANCQIVYNRLAIKAEWSCQEKFSAGMQGFGIGVQGYATVEQGVSMQRAL